MDKIYKIIYNRKGQKSKCIYETTEKALFEKYLEELKNDETVSNIKQTNRAERLNFAKYK